MEMVTSCADKSVVGSSLSQPEQTMQLITACNLNLPTKFVKVFENPTAESGVESKWATLQILLLLIKESIKPRAKSAGVLVMDSRRQLIKKLVQGCEEFKCTLILGYDSNTHHTMWGSTDINERGVLLLN